MANKGSLLSRSALYAAPLRLLVLLGVGFMILGVIATIGFVAGDSTCNAATMQNGTAVLAPTGSYCSHSQGFLTASFLILVVGAVCVFLGGLVLPTLRERNARRDAALQTGSANQHDPEQSSEDAP